MDDFKIRFFCISLFQGHRDGFGLSKECQHGTVLQTSGLGGDQVLSGGNDQPGG